MTRINKMIMNDVKNSTFSIEKIYFKKNEHLFVCSKLLQEVELLIIWMSHLCFTTIILLFVGLVLFGSSGYHFMEYICYSMLTCCDYLVYQMVRLIQPNMTNDTFPTYQHPQRSTTNVDNMPRNKAY